MANIPLKWGIIGTDGKVEINGADDSAFSSSSPAFKVNGDGTITGSFSVTSNLTVSGNESLYGHLTIGGNITFSGSHHIDYTGTKATYAMIKFKDNTADTSGNGIVIGGGGLVVVGGGESADTMAASLSGNEEKLLLCNDGNIDFYTNCQNGASSAVHTYIDTNGIFQGAVKSVYGIYTKNGGQQGPSYFGKNRAGFLMSNATVAGDSHYKNWLYMDNYDGTDVGGATALGLDRTEPRMFIMQSDANRTTWNNTAAVGVFTATPTSGGAVVADGTTGGIKTITDNITGSGSLNYIPKFTGTNTIANGFGTTESVTSGSKSLITSGAVYTGTLLRNTMVPSSTSWSVDDMRGQTRFVYTTHGTPHSGTTVAFDSSNSDNYTLQLNSNYGGAAANARLSFRTRNGDAGTWSNWLYACPVYRFNTRLEANTNKTLYVPLEMRNGTAGDCFFLVASNNYGNSGLYFLTPNTAVAHQMLITSIKAASYLTVAATTDDWGFKVTAGQAAFYLTLIRLS